MPSKGTIKGKGFFKNASRLLLWKTKMIDGSVQNTGIIGDNSTQMNVIGSSNVVQIGDTRSIDLLANHTIPGVEHDSSERDPPPQCHPGTRLDICAHARSWFHDQQRQQRILWIHGPAGVGKSAIMQTLAQEEFNIPASILGATIFFSKIRERDDPRCLFNTIAYQLAVRYKPYRNYVVNILSNDPKIVEKSIAEQFKWFIVKPFAEQNVLHGHQEMLLIMLDGLDECGTPATQRELVESLVGPFALTYPDTPLVWVIASRPEPHIVNAFNTLPQMPLVIEVKINADQACADMELFLRARFEDIRKRYGLSLTWPSEVDFLKIAAAASGHFIFGEVVMRFIDDEDYGNPISQLQVVVTTVEAAPSTQLESNPLEILDNLYARILSAIPIKVRPITMNLLALSFLDAVGRGPFFWEICNWMELSQADAYGALHKLHSVLDVPSPENVSLITRLVPFHKSFSDYIISPSRSAQFHVANSIKVALSGALRVLRESHSLLNSNVEISRIQVWWDLDREDKSTLQHRLFYVSVVLVVEEITRALAYDDESANARSSTMSQLSAFFQDVDYAEPIHLATPRPGITVTNVAGTFETNVDLTELKVKIFSVLESWGLARKIPIESIDFDRVRFGHPGQIQADGHPHDYHERSIPRFFLTHSNPWRKDESSKSTDWRGSQDQLEEHLAVIKDLELPARVYMIGKGSKSVVGIYQSMNAGFWWHYLIPYDQS